MIRKILAAIFLALVVASPVGAYQLEDICPNLEGYQSSVPHGYKLVITEDAGGNIILACGKNGQH